MTALYEANKDRLEAYLRLLLEANETMNLTAVTDFDEAVVRHLEDALAGAAYLPENAKVIDVGTGAGLPGMPLAIARPDCAFVLADTLRKRCDFLEKTVETLGLPNVTVRWARAEDLGRDEKTRETFDVAVCRALAALRLSLEYLHPLIRVGGCSLFWKGAAAEAEVAEAARALRELQADRPEILPYALPGVEGAFRIVRVGKSRPCPKKYPRRTGVPGKNPL